MDPKILWLAGAVAAVCLVSYVAPVLVPFRDYFFMYVSKMWWAILLGLAIGGLIDHYVSREYISYQLAGSTHHSIIKAVGLGFLMSACCHGIMAIAMQLYRKGASTSSVIAFLLASPWANLMWTIFLIGFFGWTKAMYIIGVSIVIALTTGRIFQFLEMSGRVERNAQTIEYPEGSQVPRFWNFPSEKPFWASINSESLKEIVQSIVTLANMVLLWALIGLVMASAIAAYVPTHLFHQYMGPSLIGMMVTLFLATVIEVCSEGSTPIAFEIYRQTGALGNSLVFLQAGVATDMTEIGLLWQNIGRRTAIWMPILTIPQILFWGWVGNIIFNSP